MLRYISSAAAATATFSLFFSLSLSPFDVFSAKGYYYGVVGGEYEKKPTTSHQPE